MIDVIYDKDRFGNHIIHARGLSKNDDDYYMKYIFYSKREAFRKFRQDFNLVGKHFNVIDVTTQKEGTQK